jgi:hypothetical protein
MHSVGARNPGSIGSFEIPVHRMVKLLRRGSAVVVKDIDLFGWSSGTGLRRSPDVFEIPMPMRNSQPLPIRLVVNVVGYFHKSFQRSVPERSFWYLCYVTFSSLQVGSPRPTQRKALKANEFKIYAFIGGWYIIEKVKFQTGLNGEILNVNLC